MVISTDRGRQQALTNLVSWREAGGFGLPEALLKAAAVHSAARALTVPGPPTMMHPADVAAHAVDLLASGELVDPVKMAADAAAARDSAACLDDARRLVNLTIESAGLRAVAVATDACDRIIVEHLRPVFDDVLDEARTIAPTLRGHDMADGWNAAPKVREARRVLTGLADRHRLIRAARTAIVGLAGQEPQHDTAGQFLLMREPQNLVPEYSANRPLPPPDVPKEPAAALLFLVTEGERGKPWLPTVPEADAAWLSVFGEALAQRRAASVGARATAGMHV